MSETSVPPQKRCTKCGRDFPAASEHFTRQKAGKYGFTSTCKTCHNEIGRQYREQNPEKVRERARLYYERYKPKVDEKHRQYRDANRDAIRIHDRARNSKPERRVLHVIRRTRDKALPSTFTAADWKQALDYFGGCCAVCGRPPGLWDTIAHDHWIPVARGGGSTADNIVPLCHSKKDGYGGCNNSKRASDPRAWLIERFGPRNAKRIEKRIADYFKSLHP